MRSRILIFGAVAVALGCSSSPESVGTASEHLSSGATVPVLGYFEAQTDFGLERHYIVIQTDELGMETYVPIEGCPDERAVRGLFGSWSAPLEYRWAPEGEQLHDRISCPEDLSRALRLYVGHGVDGTSYVEFRPRAWPSGTPIADDQLSGPSFFSIPNACGALMLHFDVIGRARQRPLAETSGTPPAGSRIVPLTCGFEAPTAPDSGWSLERMRSTIRTGGDGVDGTNVFRLARGETSLYIRAVDGVELSTLDSEQQRARFDALWARWDLRGDREQAFHLWDEPYMTVWSIEPSEAPETVTFDVCLERCGDATWKPRHRGVEPTDAGDYVTRCLGPIGREEGCMDTFSAVPGALLYEPYARTQIGPRPFLLPRCAPDVEWKRVLGLKDPSSFDGWAAERAGEYALVSSAENPGGTEQLACLRESRTCVVKLAEQYDLSKLDVVAQANTCVAAGSSVLRVQLGQQARLTGKTLKVEGDKLPKDAAGRPKLQEIALVGPASGATVTVADPVCSTSTGSCAAAVPAIAVDGDISLRLHELRVVEGSVKAGRQAVARDVVSASRGARLRVTHSAFGAPESVTPFYRGVVVDGATAQVLDSSVRAFRYAFSARDAAVAAASLGASVAVGALPNKAAAYYDLDGRRLASAGDFAAFELSGASTAFVARLDVFAPTGFIWNNMTYQGSVSRTRTPDLWTMDLTYQSWPVPSFPTSTLVSVLGTGNLYFARPAVSAKSVVRCDGGPAALEFYLPEWFGDTQTAPPSVVRQCVIDSNLVERP